MSAPSSRLFIKVWRGCTYTVHQGDTPVTAGKYALFRSIPRSCCFQKTRVWPRWDLLLCVKVEKNREPEDRACDEGRGCLQNALHHLCHLHHLYHLHLLQHLRGPLAAQLAPEGVHAPLGESRCSSLGLELLGRARCVHAWVATARAGRGPPLHGQRVARLQQCTLRATGNSSLLCLFSRDIRTSEGEGSIRLNSPSSVHGD